MESTKVVHTSAAPTLSSIDVLSNIVVKSVQGSSRTETSGSYVACQYADKTHRVDVGGVYECSTQPLTPLDFDQIMGDLVEIRTPLELPVPVFAHDDDDDFQQHQPKPPKPLKKSVASDPRLKNDSKRRRQRSKPRDSGKEKKKSRSSGSVLKKLLTSAPASGIRNGDVDAMVVDITSCPALLSPIPSSGSVSGSHEQQTEATPVLNSGNLFETCIKYLDSVEERAGGLEKSINSRSEEIYRLKQKLCELEAANSQEQSELNGAKKVIGMWREAFIHRWTPS